MTEALFTGTGLAKHFAVKRSGGRGKATVYAVDGVDLAIAPGECLALVGESGCGKSTLASLVSLLEEPSAGDVRFEGAPICADRRSKLRFRRDVQIVLQDPFASLNPRMTIEDILSEPFEIHGDLAPRAEWRGRVTSLLKLVGLGTEHLERYPHEFSGGQRQRISIARALAVEPRMLVLDEPLSALDVSVQAQIVTLLKDLQARLGLSYLFISHDLAVVRSMADRVAVMYLGRIVEEGPTERVYGTPSHPYTRALLSSSPIPDPETRETRQRIQLTGEVPSPIDPPSGCPFRTRCWRAVEACSTVRPELESRPAPDGGHRVACFRPGTEEPGT